MKIKILILSLVLVACSHGSFEKWNTKDINGFKLSLLDRKRVEVFSFSSSHNWVIAEIGTIDVRTAPVLSWEIDKDGILLIKESDSSVLYKLSKLNEADGIITVEQTDNSFLKRFFHEKLRFEKEKIEVTESNQK